MAEEVEHQVLSNPLIHVLAEEVAEEEYYPHTQKVPPLPSFHQSVHAAAALVVVAPVAKVVQAVKMVELLD